MAGNEELSELSVLSGVMLRLCAFGAERFVACGGGETGALDQEKVAAGDALFVDLVRLLSGREGSTVVGVVLLAHGSPPSMSLPPDVP